VVKEPSAPEHVMRNANPSVKEVPEHMMKNTNPNQ